MTLVVRISTELGDTDGPIYVQVARAETVVPAGTSLAARQATGDQAVAALERLADEVKRDALSQAREYAMMHASLVDE